MRCVLDTNVLVARALLPDPAPRRCEALRRAADLARRGTLLFSAATLEELRAVLLRPGFERHRPVADRLAFLAGIEAAATLVEPPTVAPLCRDPDDDKFLALALAGQADALVTQDRDLLVLRRIGATPIQRPEAFLAGVCARAAKAHPIVHHCRPG